MTSEANTPAPQPVTIFLKPTFAIVPSESGLDVRVAAAKPPRPAPRPKKPTAQA